MKQTTMVCGDKNIKCITSGVVVVGSGAAGFAAALRLWRLGVRDVAIITEGVLLGTSRNTGSDKQTYYKLGLAGDVADSPMDMARDFFSGGLQWKGIKKPKMKVNQGGRKQDYDYNAQKKAQSDEIDRILDKLKKSGYSSLTTEEKKRLFDASKK